MIERFQTAPISLKNIKERISFPWEKKYLRWTNEKWNDEAYKEKDFKKYLMM